MNIFWFKIAQMLLSRLNFMDNFKTMTGAIAFVLGIVVYVSTAFGITPTPLDPEVRMLVDFFIDLFIGGGGALMGVGLGHKMGKIETAEAIDRHTN